MQKEQSEINKKAWSYPSDEQIYFPDCLLRYWNLGQIVTAVAASGLVIEQLVEEPRNGKHSFIPGSFTLTANMIERNY